MGNFRNRIKDATQWGIPKFDEEDGIIYNCNQFDPYYQADELLALRDAIDKTLLLYKEKGITNEDIFSANKEAREASVSSSLSNRDKITDNKKECCGDLYLIKDTINNSLKIGRSINVKARLKQLQIATSNKLQLIEVIKGAGDTEGDVHETFAKYRLNSEWFRYTEEIVGYFKNLKNE